MEKNPNIEELRSLAQTLTGQAVTDIVELPKSGSHRVYYRIALQDGNTLIGAFNDDIVENRAFFSYTRFFMEKGFPVPILLAVAPDNMHYLQSDLGNETLYDHLFANRTEKGASPETIAYYEKAVRALPALQLSGKEGLDFSVAYPRAAFDRQSMQWDLNYFKYFFLKLANVPFNEQRLEDDFNTLMDYLLTADGDYFLYRDFQSRNIMLKDGEVYFIDYQGGRKGALQYDLASLLYQVRADLSPALREHLLNVYLDTLSERMPVDRKAFVSYFQGFVLIRILQAMGAYGYRGYYERKSHFLQSIPFAVRNLQGILDHYELPMALPELTSALRAIIASDFVKPYRPGATLTVRVQSFSYRAAIPQDPSPNGGGFVFDCRVLPNPGREPRFRAFTGRDACVQEYLLAHPEIHDFERHVFALVDAAVDNYLTRHFDHLMVSFGCTGGQHRSVFFAERTAQHLACKYPEINIILKHTAQEK
ncbi:MAG: phosphotransferase [Bacteroidales bacterium]|nr:phosphotransferase [Bacteroidales bacterium]